jgi:hypothetical protein
MIDDSKTFELLSEIAKLLKRYGKETFCELVTILRDPKLSIQVADCIENIANIPIKKKSIQKRLSAAEERIKFRETLVDLGKTEPEKSKILLFLFDSLHDKTILPTLRELNDFISDHNLPIPRSKSRDKVIISFVKNCNNLSLKDIQLLDLPNGQRHALENSDRSLEGWGKVILDRKSKKD